MRRILAIAFLVALARGAPAQVGACKANAAPQCRDSQVISASGNSINVWGNGALSGAFEEVIAGSPNTVSIVIQGCADGGTCATLDTYTTVANSVRAPAIAAPYAYYSITATWSGGSGVSVTVNTRLTTAALGSGGPLPQTCNAAAVPDFGQALCEYTLTSAQILAFDGTAATAVAVISAPGSGRAIVPNAATGGAEYFFHTAAYSATDIFQGTWGATVSGQILFSLDLSQATNQVAWGSGAYGQDNLDASTIANSAFSIFAESAVTGGAGTVVLFIPYTVYPVA